MDPGSTVGFLLSATGEVITAFKAVRDVVAGMKIVGSGENFKAAIELFMNLYRKNISRKNSLKLHLIEDHVADFCLEWRVGLESLHTKFNGYARQFEHIKPATSRLLKQVEEHALFCPPNMSASRIMASTSTPK